MNRYSLAFGRTRKVTVAFFGVPALFAASLIYYAFDAGVADHCLPRERRLNAVYFVDDPVAMSRCMESHFLTYQDRFEKLRQRFLAEGTDEVFFYFKEPYAVDRSVEDEFRYREFQNRYFRRELTFLRVGDIVSAEYSGLNGIQFQVMQGISREMDIMTHWSYVYGELHESQRICENNSWDQVRDKAIEGESAWDSCAVGIKDRWFVHHTWTLMSEPLLSSTPHNNALERTGER